MRGIGGPTVCGTTQCVCVGGGRCNMTAAATVGCCCRRERQVRERGADRWAPGRIRGGTRQAEGEDKT